jgi:hypothetical protein
MYLITPFAQLTKTMADYFQIQTPRENNNK